MRLRHVRASADPAHHQQAKTTARDGLAEARSLVWALRPDLLQGKSLEAILAEVQNRKDPESGEWILSPGQLVTMVVHSSRPKLDPVRK